MCPKISSSCRRHIQLNTSQFRDPTNSPTKNTAAVSPNYIQLPPPSVLTKKKSVQACLKNRHPFASAARSETTRCHNLINLSILFCKSPLRYQTYHTNIAGMLFDNPLCSCSFKSDRCLRHCFEDSIVRREEL
jgi:hypothetical protein